MTVIQTASANPYVVAALIGAIPATISSIAAWRNSHQGRKENRDDHAVVKDRIDSLADGIRSVRSEVETVNTRLERVDAQFARLDIRLDSIEDKVERHLGWHRTQAEQTLEEALHERNIKAPNLPQRDKKD